MGCELNLCWFYWLEIGFGWKLEKMDTPGSSHLEGEWLFMQCPHPCGFCINTWPGRRALLAGALAGPLTCLGLLGLVGVGGG